VEFSPWLIVILVVFVVLTIYQWFTDETRAEEGFIAKVRNVLTVSTVAVVFLVFWFFVIAMFLSNCDPNPCNGDWACEDERNERRNELRNSW
jgi:hypothetical protein